MQDYFPDFQIINNACIDFWHAVVKHPYVSDWQVRMPAENVTAKAVAISELYY